MTFDDELKRSVKKVIVSERELKKAIKALAKKMTKDLEGEDLVVVGLLTGCIPFLPDLLKQLKLKVLVNYIQASSYEGQESSGKVKIGGVLKESIIGKHVVLVDDIIDTGVTLKELSKYLYDQGAKKVTTCVLASKIGTRKVEFEADYKALEVPNEFVFGYGLDYDGYYRNLPYIAALKDELYK